jgi:Tol biopolymer transport system component
MSIATGAWQRIGGSAETGRETSVQAIWSPNDSAVAFVQSLSPPALRAVSMATGAVRTLRELPFRQRASQPGGNTITDWSPDGSRLAIAGGNEAWEYDIRADSAWLLFKGDGALTDLRYHPGGDWVAYATALEGRADVFLRRTNGAGEPIRVSSDGGRQPRWNSTGTELYYIDARDNVVAIPVRVGAAPALGSTTIVVPASTFASRNPDEFGVSPDGKRFYFIVSSDTRSLDLVLNWRMPDK